MKTTSKTRVILFLAMGMIMIYSLSCRHEPDVILNGGTTPVDPPPDTTLTEDPCDSNIVYFENQILPILNSNCATSGCHDAATYAEDIVLSSYGSIFASIKLDTTFPYTNPSPANNKLYESLIQGGEEGMPYGLPPLPQYQIDLIYKWLQQGAQNNYCSSSACDSVNVTFTKTIWPMIQTSCKGCHSGASPGGGIPLSTYAEVSAASPQPILKSITHTGTKPMPKGAPKLSDCKIAQFNKWVADGKPNN